MAPTPTSLLTLRGIKPWDDFGVVDLGNNAIHALGNLDTDVTVKTPDWHADGRDRVLRTHHNEIVYLAGDTVTYAEVADKLETALERRFTRSEWTVPFLMQELSRDPQNMMRKYRAAFAQGRGVA